MTIEKGLFADNENKKSESEEAQNDLEDESLEIIETGDYLAFNLIRGQKKQSRLDIRRRDGSGTIIYNGYIATIEYSGNEKLSFDLSKFSFYI